MAKEETKQAPSDAGDAVKEETKQAPSDAGDAVKEGTKQVISAATLVEMVDGQPVEREPGTPVTLPAEQADSLVARGLAVLAPTPPAPS